LCSDKETEDEKNQEEMQKSQREIDHAKKLQNEQQSELSVAIAFLLLIVWLPAINERMKKKNQE
jgi:hypothetical protein